MSLPPHSGKIAHQMGKHGEIHNDRYVGETDLTRWSGRLGSFVRDAARSVADKLGPYAALLISLLSGLVIALVLSIVAAQVYDAVTDKDGVAGIDQPLLQLALSLRSPVADTIVTAVTDTAGPIGMPIIAVAAIVFLGLRRRSWTPAILISAAAAGSLLMTIAGKNIIARDRPPLVDAVPPYEYSPSFPSGHTLNAVVVVGVIAYLLLLRQHSRRTRTLIITGLVVFVLFIGLTRVYLGHHWFTDVLAGWLLGFAWLALIITAHRVYLTARVHHHTRAAS